MTEFSFLSMSKIRSNFITFSHNKSEMQALCLNEEVLKVSLDLILRKFDVIKSFTSRNQPMLYENKVTLCKSPVL